MREGADRTLGWRRLLLFSTLVLLLVLALAEWLSRMDSDHRPGEPQGMPEYLTREGLHEDSPLPYRPIPGTWGVCQVNEHGLWGPAPEMPKPVDVLRVVAVGGSTTQGVCPHRFDPSSYPLALQQLLADFRPAGKRVEVLNAGVEGFRAGDAAEWLRTRVLPLQPDVVLVYSGWNDLATVGPQVPGAGLAASAVASSAAAQQLRRAVHRAHAALAKGPSGAASPWLDYFPERFVEGIDEIVALSRSGGAVPVLITQCSNLRLDMPEEVARRKVVVPLGLRGVDDVHALWLVHSQVLRDRADALEVDLIDGALAMQRSDADELMFDHMHPDTEGYGVLAGFIEGPLRPILARAAEGKP
jgi:lysophospholipase L1-like esterase